MNKYTFCCAMLTVAFIAKAPVSIIILWMVLTAIDGLEALQKGERIDRLAILFIISLLVPVIVNFLT